MINHTFCRLNKPVLESFVEPELYIGYTDYHYLLTVWLFTFALSVYLTQMDERQANC